MSTLDLRRFSKGVSALALAGFFLVPAAARAQVPVTGATVKQAVKLDELASLKSALKLLETANHDYKGHRAKAVHAIHEAIHEIEHHGQKHVPTSPAVAAAKAAIRASTPKTGGQPPVHEAQAVSDKQLLAAAELLSKVFTDLTATGKHPKATAHVQIAVQELQTALTIL
jgi:hypothetical protein